MAPCFWQQAIWLFSSDSTRSRLDTARGEIQRAHIATPGGRVETKIWQKFGYESYTMEMVCFARYAYLSLLMSNCELTIYSSHINMPYFKVFEEKYITLSYLIVDNRI